MTYMYLVLSTGHQPQAAAVEVEQSGMVGATIALNRVIERFIGYPVKSISIEGDGITLTLERHQ